MASGEPCSFNTWGRKGTYHIIFAKEGRVRIISYLRKKTFKRPEAKKEKKRAKRTKQSKNERFPGLELASSSPTLHPTIWTGGPLKSAYISYIYISYIGPYIISEKNVSRYTRRMHVWRTAHGAQSAQTWMILIVYPKPVPAQESQSYGKPCCFQRDTYEQKYQTLEKNKEKQKTPHRETWEIVVSTPEEKKL